MYDFDVVRLYLRLTPWFLRRELFNSWISVIAVPATYVKNLLLALFNQINYDFLFNAQIIYLEHVLNEQFPDSDPDIYIENVFTPPLYLNNQAEAQTPIYMRNNSEADPLYMKNAEEFINSTQYIVHVDADISDDEDEIAALIDTYNLSGMIYEIQFDL